MGGRDRLTHQYCIYMSSVSLDIARYISEKSYLAPVHPYSLNMFVTLLYHMPLISSCYWLAPNLGGYYDWFVPCSVKIYFSISKVKSTLIWNIWYVCLVLDIKALMRDEIDGCNSMAPIWLGAELNLPILECDSMGTCICLFRAWDRRTDDRWDRRV